MVKLTKIYTRTGDDGTTGLGTGARVPKSSLRVEAYGAVDEANAAIGLAVVASRASDAGERGAEIGSLLASIQQDLFDAGADLCVPLVSGESGKLRIVATQTARLEAAIDRFNERLAPLTSFVLPGGTALAAALHLARTVTRRAEREVVRLTEAEPRGVSPEVVKYLNRLSDLLFVLSRAANGGSDVLWVPGANRGTGP
ncbi:MAG: cob(I)yrinic acid a,c-diamide adenosyltransferase [Phycisphaerae bacterium]|nr:cob(I)yrinic acid a,c-diamide adenosyltransferase [Phycisphaerae bacterium]